MTSAKFIKENLNEVNLSNHKELNILSTIDQDIGLYSISVDIIKAQIRMLKKYSIVLEKDEKKLLDCLTEIKNDITNQGVRFHDSDLDVHSFVTRLLDNKLDESTRHYLNILCPSNESNIAIIRIWLLGAIDTLDESLRNMQSAIIDKVEANTKTIIPTYIYGNIGQPISIGHHIISYAEMIGRDRQKLEYTRELVNKCPLGAYNMAGTSLDINRKILANILNFKDIIMNTVDAINDNDFAIEFIFSLSLCMMHLSRIVEDILLWQHPNSSFIYFSERPELSYPRMLEGIRVKIGIIYGNLFNMLTSAKSLKIGVSSDIGIVNPIVINSYLTTLSCIKIITSAIKDFKIDSKKTKAKSQDNNALVPDIIAWIMLNLKLNHSESRNIANNIVNYSIKHNKKLSLLTIDELKAINPKINDDIYSVLILSRAIVSRRSLGGSNPVQLKKLIRAIKHKFLSN